MSLCPQCLLIKLEPEQVVCRHCVLANVESNTQKAKQTNADGLHGTDKPTVVPLFTDRPSAIGPAPQPGGQSPSQSVVEALELLMLQAASGKITAMAVVCFDQHETLTSGTFGQGRYTTFLGGLEDLKYEILQEHRVQHPRRPVK